MIIVTPKLFVIYLWTLFFSLQENDGLSKKQQWSHWPKKGTPFNVSYFVKKQLSNVSKNWIRKQTCDPLLQILEFRSNLCKVWLKRLRSLQLSRPKGFLCLVVIIDRIECFTVGFWCQAIHKKILEIWHKFWKKIDGENICHWN